MKIKLKKIIVIIGIVLIGLLLSLKIESNHGSNQNSNVQSNSIKPDGSPIAVKYGDGDTTNGVKYYNLDTIIIPETANQFSKVLLERVFECYKTKECVFRELGSASNNTTLNNISFTDEELKDAIWDGYAIRDRLILIRDENLIYTAAPIDYSPYPVEIPLSLVSKYLDLNQPSRITSELSAQKIFDINGQPPAVVILDKIGLNFVSGYINTEAVIAITDEGSERFKAIKVNGVWKVVELGRSKQITCDEAMKLKNDALIASVCN